MSISTTPPITAQPSYNLLGPNPEGFWNWMKRCPAIVHVLIVLCSILFASPIGTNRLLVYGENFVGDILLVPLTIYLLFFSKWATYTRSPIIGGSKPLLYLIVFFLFLEGCLTTHGEIAASYTDARCAFLMLVFFFLCRAPSAAVRRNVIYLAGEIALCSLISSAFYYQFMASIEDGVKNFYPPFALLLLSIIAANERGVWLEILGLVLSLYIAATSFYRSIMFIPLVFIVLLTTKFVQSLLMHKRASKTNAPIILGVIILALFFGSAVIEFFDQSFHASAGTIDQGINKLNNVLYFFDTGELGEGDDVRQAYLDYIGDHFFAFLLPSGFGVKSTLGHWGPFWADDKMAQYGSSTDGAHLFLFCHVGIILTAIIVLYLAKEIVKSAITIRWSLLAKIIIFILGFIQLFASASQFVIISSSISFGALLGCLTTIPTYPNQGDFRSRFRK